MTSSPHPRPLNLHVDIVGRIPNLKIYTQITFCYSLPDHILRSSIISTLTNGLERMSKVLPWTAGQVVDDNDGGKTASPRIIGFRCIPRLDVKDISKDSSITMDGLRRGHFPFTMLDETLIAPIRTIPTQSGKTLPQWPVFVAQATFIRGGLLLTFLGHHQTMDGIGQSQVISLFSKACRGIPFTESDITDGNLPRQNIVPFLDESYEPGPELAQQLKTTESSGSDGTEPPPPSTWVYFSFSHTSLASLKAIATDGLPQSTPFVSTDDALAAFIYQSIARARSYRLDPDTPSQLARAADVRKALGVPSTYCGMLQIMTYHMHTIQDLTTRPLGSIAADLRAALSLSDLAYRTRALVTYLNRYPTESHNVSFTAQMDLSKDLMLSSWANQNSYDLDFGLGLGKPEAVRRPRFSPFESLGYFMPRDKEGGIAVGICLREQDLATLRADEEFMKFCEFLG